MRIDAVTLYRLELPLTTPYRIALAEYGALDPIVAEVRDSDGRVAWAETQITPGYCHETPEGAWEFLREQAAACVGGTIADAKAMLSPFAAEQPGAVAALLPALEMLEGNPLLGITAETRVPLLAPVQAKSSETLRPELEDLLGQGFRTFKVKVGWDVDADLGRVSEIQEILDGRAEIRIDANQGYSAQQGIAFATALDPTGVVLFEQPCHEADWEANAAVAAASTVPVMMDEAIYGLADIDRACALPGVGFVKLKLKKLGGLAALREGLERIRAQGCTPVLGDGMSVEIACWMEACVASALIDNAGEMNGFLKQRQPLLADPLPFVDGAIVLRPGWVPEPDPGMLLASIVDQEEFRPTRVALSGAAE